ncbi:MAG: TonB-dependent receptor [Planctomycetaceae bacterium]|nr:TonB-dependent receptor [Planctomycetaceae bacterium]
MKTCLNLKRLCLTVAVGVFAVVAHAQENVPAAWSPWPTPFDEASTASPLPPSLVHPPSLIHQVQYNPPIAPREQPQNGLPETPAISHKLTSPQDLFGSVNQVNQLDENRRRLAHSPASDVVFGAESKGRVTNDVGDLLRKAISSHGVSTQERTPITTDTRVRGQKAGQVLASGSYWTPARMDLDTMMNKIDSRLVADVIVIKGPYSSRYGPGFRFVDFDLIQTPRYTDFESHGSTSFDYDSNGEQPYGRQSLWGGSEDWGYRVSYGIRSGSDYQTGAGTEIPASYKSRDLFVAFGWDVSPTEHYEFNYLRLDQTDVEFPGLVYDINYLVTDGFELKYVNTAPELGDRLDSEVWLNATRFEGDTLKSGKARQIPNLSTILYSPIPGDGYAITNVAGKSMGYRTELTFGEVGDTQMTIGSDLTHVRQKLNDIEPLIPDPNDNNFPIPPSYSVDTGLFWEGLVPVNESLVLSTGSRVDLIAFNADNEVAGVPITIADNLDTDSLQREMFLWSGFVSAEYKLDESWSATLGTGYAQRPPTLTELYTNDSFIGSLQRGLTALEGDPQLKPERLKQIDVGLTGNYDDVRLGAHGYFSWIDDMITYDLLSPAGGAGGVGGFAQSAQFVNTKKAILAGFETYGEADLAPWLTSFGTLSYIEGRDLSRDAASRFGMGGRSGILGRNHEPLPGISPLESRVGLRLHDAASAGNWGLETSARIVDNQDRIASSLEEIATPGFTTYDVRFFKRKDAWLLTTGVENLTNKYYREHLDYRTGRGVYRPGVNFYAGVEVTY